MEADIRFARPLPPYLAVRYHDWHTHAYADNADRFRNLADEGQHPSAMVISCCDSRVHPTAIFEAAEGELFMHRNIASLVPPFTYQAARDGTPAAIEYAVMVLKVKHLVVIGHSSCGGVEGCYKMCSGEAPELESRASFVGNWIEILRPGYERLDPDAPEEQRKSALEKLAVQVSLENLMSFPFVVQAVASGQLSLHGLWTDIGTGELYYFDGENSKFLPVD